VSCSAYELKVGSEAFVTRDKSDQLQEISQGRTPGHLVPGLNESICIPSGQFAFLITAEKVRIPNDAIGFISMKASKKWQGLVNVSGFHVDPGWNDHLIFGVFNAGPQTLIIKPGEPFFLLFYADLDNVAEEKFRYTVYKLNDNVRELREDAKSAQNRSNVSLTFGIAAMSLAIASISIAVAVFFRQAVPQSTVNQTPAAVVAPASSNGSPAASLPPLAIPKPAGKPSAERPPAKGPANAPGP
jgi:deoxycytidine triphosphate deaminase